MIVVQLLQLVGIGLILYSGALLIQSYLTDDRPSAEQLSQARHERRQAWAASAPQLRRQAVDNMPLRLGRAAADRWADVLANGMLDQLLNPPSLEEQLAA